MNLLSSGYHRAATYIYVVLQLLNIFVGSSYHEHSKAKGSALSTCITKLSFKTRQNQKKEWGINTNKKTKPHQGRFLLKEKMLWR